MRLYNSRYEVDSFPYDRALNIWRNKRPRRGMANISNPSGSGSGGCSDIRNGSGSDSDSGGGIAIGGGIDSGSCLDIGSNDDEVDFGMHTNSESEENTTNNQMLYEINEDDSDNSDAEPIKPEWKL